MIIVGSQALIRAIGPVRRPVDIDMFGREIEARKFMAMGLGQSVKDMREEPNKIILFGDKGAILEVELTDHSTNKEIHNRMVLESKDSRHASLDWLYFLKMSHRYKKDSSHFLKTMQDIHLMRMAGAKMPEGSEELFALREKETYTNKLPDLTVDKDKFFKKTEDFYVYDHDTIHEAVAIFDKPAYTHYVADGEQVKCDRAKFDALPHEMKLAGVVEESYVLALERAIIPHGNKVPPKVAFDTALEKVCTSITSGWFREFAWENYFQAQAMYRPDFVVQFNEALAQGKIADFKR